jgi:hypothetical protein
MSESPIRRPAGKVTFRGHGLAYVHGDQIILKLCPECVQWNAPKAAVIGQCGWCGYVPSLAQAEPSVKS